MKQARTFWRLVFEQTGSLSCIYSGQVIDKNDFSLDHFLPWRFVTHDLLWNIIPTPKNINSAKSDNLPRFDLYFNSFAVMQYNAVKTVSALGNANLLEDYTLLFKNDVKQIKQLSVDNFSATLRDTIAPQVQIAQNMGFAANWSYAVP